MAKFRKKPVVIEAFRLNERGLIAENWFWPGYAPHDIEEWLQQPCGGDE